MRRLLLLLLIAVLATETVAIAVHAPRSVATSDSPVLSTNGTVVWWYLATKSYTYPPNHLVYSNTLLFFENADTPPSLKFVELKTGQVFRTVPLNASYSVLDASSDLLIVGGEEGLLALSWSGKVLWRTIWSVKGVEVGNSSLVVWNEAELLFLDRETGSILYTTPFEWGIPLFAVSRGDVLYTVERNTTSDSVAVCAYRLPNLTLITESSPLTEVSLTPVVVRICFLSGDRMVVGIRGFCVAGLDVNTLAIAYEVEEVVDFTVVDDHDADGVKDLCVIMQQGLYLLSGKTGGFLAWVSEESYVWVERVGHDANEDGVEDVCCAFSSEEGEVVGFISVKQESRMIGWMRLKLGLLTITRVNDVNGDRRADLLLSTIYGYVLLLSVTDFHPPLVEIVAPENESVVKSPIVVKAVLWDFESGVASATCFLDGVAHQMSVNESIGGSTAQLCLDAGEGWHTLYIEVEDFAGNRQTTPFFRILVDNTPPMISIVSPPNQTILANTTLDICWTVYDDVSGVNAQQVVVQPLGYEVQLPPSTHNLTLQVPQDGVVTVILTAYDHAGNAGSTTCTVIVDAQPPQVRIEQPMNGSFISETAIEIGWSCEDTGSGISSVVVRVDNRIVYEGNETM
ncbi:hypothetical protein DRN94_004210, partial [archaeon]|nr:hypothetical protein [archaeon]